MGRGASALPWYSHLRPLGHGQGVVHLDARMSDGALNFCVSKEPLSHEEDAGPPIEQGCLRPSQGARSNQRRIEAIASNPAAPIVEWSGVQGRLKTGPKL